MTQSVPSQRKQLYKLFSYNKEIEAKHIQTITNGKYSTAKDLSMFQATNLIKKLSTNWAAFTTGNKQHMYILSLCMQYGWQKTHDVTLKPIADLNALNKWLKGVHKSGQSPVLKPLNQMDPKELSIVIYALEQMIDGKFK